VAALVVVFVVVAGYLIYKNQSSGGRSIRFDVTVTHADSMNPSELDAHQSDMITISITSDVDGEVHLHGYDHAFDLKTGVVTAYSFPADKTGDFEIEWEETSARLGHLVVMP